MNYEVEVVQSCYFPILLAIITKWILSLCKIELNIACNGNEGVAFKTIFNVWGG